LRAKIRRNDIKETRADEAEDDHPRHTVRAACDVHPILLEEPQTKARGGEDSEHGEHAMPRDEERPDMEQVRVQVDDDGQKSHACSFGMLATAR
jgi:hypothetical protein